MGKFELIDSHTHLDGSDFDLDRDEVVRRAFEAGVTTIVNIGATDGFEGAKRTLALADKYDGVFATCGIHPHDANRPVDIAQLRALAIHPKVQAIGETGLDFFKEWSPKEKQYEWFESQIELALELQIPLVIHSRAAAEECLAVLKRAGADTVGGVFHCYDQDAVFAQRLFELNFIISVTGVVTFPKATNIHQMVKDVPLERMMIETDSPFLAPVPYRGKRCESAYVIETARAIAAIKDISIEEVARVTTATARSFYKL